MKPIQVNINGQTISAYAQKIKNDLWVHFLGKTIKVPYSDMNKGSNGRKKTADSKGSSDKIFAPMPGKITKILVQKEQTILAGETVLVMEAMKMEYTLKSDFEACIFNINCQVGDQVQLGDELVHLIPKV